jgi:hypothetical protein
MVFVSGRTGQSMASELKIRWDGNVSGIAEKRLSLDAFAGPLELLLAALRRIATQMVSNAIEGESPKSGRFADVARWIDIEIVDIAHQSSGFDALVVFHNPPDELNLWGDLPSRATVELLDAIEVESRGQMRNGGVRNFIRALPLGLHRQLYEYTNGAGTKRVEIGDVKLADVPEEFPFFREVTGSVVGVGFEPGRSEVRVKGEGPVAAFDAEPEQVETALNLRHENIRALGVHAGKHSRLLRIGKASEARLAVTAEMIEEHIFHRWSGVFARLAK